MLYDASGTRISVLPICTRTSWMISSGLIRARRISERFPERPEELVPKSGAATLAASAVALCGGDDTVFAAHGATVPWQCRDPARPRTGAPGVGAGPNVTLMSP